jgi:ABC-type transport system involved in multi-copper enzyme maturation permease subunit
MNIQLLIKIEWLKIKKYPAFWWMLGIVTLTYPGVNMMFHNIYDNITQRKDVTGNIAKFLLGNPFAFPDAWHSVAYFSSWFVMVPAILVIMLISNEYNFKTHRQNVIDGWSREQFITSKLSDVLIITLIVTVIYFIVAAIFGFYYSDSTAISRWSEELQYIPLFMLETFSQLSIAFLLGFLLRKAFIALGLYFFYTIIIENALKAYLSFKRSPVGEYLPVEISNRLVPRPNFLGRINPESNEEYKKILSEINVHVILTLLLTSVIWWICYTVYKKKDL